MNPIRFLLSSLRWRFTLPRDDAGRRRTAEEIRRGAEFRGTNSWLLILAMLIASIGLNFDSTPAVIGAMLVSPLMGPIMGLGLGTGTYDMALIRRSLANLAFMVGTSLASSWLYFAATPIHAASSELLARTSPTAWDAAIALFGGFAGILGSHKGKGNALAGAAIATALMPPLCTAGFALANGRAEDFLGAAYLFSINAVMIGFATAVTVRALEFPPSAQAGKHREIRLATNAVVFVTALPSIWLGYRLVERSVFEDRVRSFLSQELNLPGTQAFVRGLEASPRRRRAHILLLGDPLPDSTLARIRGSLSRHNLSKSEIEISQGSYFALASATRDSLAGESQALLAGLHRLDATTRELRRRLDSLSASRSESEMPPGLLQELRSIDPSVVSVALGPVEAASIGRASSQAEICVLGVTGSPNATRRARLESFLRTRLRAPEMMVSFLPKRAANRPGPGGR